MDRVIVLRRLDGSAVAEKQGAAWIVDAEHPWVAEGDPADITAIANAIGSAVKIVAPNAALLGFGNDVGRYRAGPLGYIDVHSGKWNEARYDAMLDDIARVAATLPFHAGADSSLPTARDQLGSDILYHACLWLRHAVLEGEAALLGAFHAVVADPHRRAVQRERLVPLALASRISSRAIDEIAVGARPLQRVARGRGIAGFSVAPVEITETIAASSVDTPENRFVLAFLDECVSLLDRMRRVVIYERPTFASRVRATCDDIQGALAPIICHRLWEDVGRMHFFPASSTTLHRRAPYREILRHFVMLHMGTRALPFHSDVVTDLLEVKDIAKLYELWAALSVIDVVQLHKGTPAHVQAPAVDDLNAKVRAGLLARWEDGTEVGYNVTYSSSGGSHGRSWSVSLRPDVYVWIPKGDAKGLHLFDAKFRLDKKVVEDTEANTAKPTDIHKMHAYRDAIPEVRSAWVMYPGSVLRFWSDGASTKNKLIDGVGAVPVVPNDAHLDLNQLIERLVQEQ